MQVVFKNCAPFTKCIIKIDGTTIHDAEDLDLVMPMYNLIEYSSDYFETTGSLWFYSKNGATDFNANIANIDDFISFKYKAKLILFYLGDLMVIRHLGGVLGLFLWHTCKVTLSCMDNTKI